MYLEIYRVSEKQYTKALSGKGAALYGGRWNPKGIEVIYAAEHKSLAITEVFFHNIPLEVIRQKYVILTLRIPKSVEPAIINMQDLPKGWDSKTSSGIVEFVGKHFVEDGKTCVLRVPSAIVGGEFNYLINPAHLDFKKIKIIATEEMI